MTFPEAAPHLQKGVRPSPKVILSSKRLHSFREGERTDQ